MLVDWSGGPLGPVLVLNPLRDRAPEQVADRFLRLLRTKECRAALGQIGLAAGTIESICEKERVFAPDRFDLQRRDDSGNKIQLVFNLSARDRKDVAGICVLTVRREGGFDWQVSGYDREY